MSTRPTWETRIAGNRWRLNGRQNDNINLIEPGQNGVPGKAGKSGKELEIEFEKKNCIKCPAGLPGMVGSPGIDGLPGEIGSPGLVWEAI